MNLLRSGVSAVHLDDGFSVQPPSAQPATASKLLDWLAKPENEEAATIFAEWLAKSLKSCVEGSAPSQKEKREKMWEAYHQFRTSQNFVKAWSEFLETSIDVIPCPIFYQYVTQSIFNMLLKVELTCTQGCSASTTVTSLTYEEANALRYAAGYVPRALHKKLQRSAHPLRVELQLCLSDLVGEEDDDDDSQDWVRAIDRGGLKHVHSMTYHLFVAMELKLRQCLPNFIDIDRHINEDNDVLFYWCIISAEWEEEESKALLPMVTSMWVTIRGFAYTSAWMEEYKAAHHRSVRKSKGVRKQLLATRT